MIIESDRSSSLYPDKNNDDGGDLKKLGTNAVEEGSLKEYVEMEVIEIHDDDEENIEVVVQKMIYSIEKKEVDVVEEEVLVKINGVDQDKGSENNWSMEREIKTRGLFDVELEGEGSAGGVNAKVEGNNINNYKFGELMGWEHEGEKILQEYTCSYPCNWEILDGGCKFWGVSEHEALSNDWEVSLWYF